MGKCAQNLSVPALMHYPYITSQSVSQFLPQLTNLDFSLDLAITVQPELIANHRTGVKFNQLENVMFLSQNYQSNFDTGLI